MFKYVYVRSGNETIEQLHVAMVEKSIAILQEATLQLPLEILIEDVTVLEDVGFQIMTNVLDLDQNFGRCHGKVVRCTGKVQVRETCASSSRSNTAEVDALKEEVTTLKGQFMAQGEEMGAYAGTVRDLVQAIQMFGLQISLPAIHLAPPSTSEPPRSTDTQ